MPDAGPVAWERWPEIATYRVAVARQPSQHLAADHEGETLANEAFPTYPSLGPARSSPAGAVLVQRLYAPGAAAPDVVFAMVRLGERAQVDTTADGSSASAEKGWEYLIVDPNGLIEARGALEACARCHAEAPHDGLFGQAR